MNAPTNSSLIDPQSSVASIVLAHSETARLFQELRIDFCCKGEQSLTFACASRKLPLADVISALSDTISARGDVADVAPVHTRSQADLVQFIVDTHHAYLRESLPFIGGLAAKVARVHGDRNPRLEIVKTLVDALTEALVPHLEYEEVTLFPAILAAKPESSALADEVVKMKEEHLAVGELLGRLRDETDSFSPPDWACTSYRTLFAELERLELDTLRHVHLENHVLVGHLSVNGGEARS
ncbi:MAG: DUF542 domain-containing protein [Polyangiaceae bacterium]